MIQKKKNIFLAKDYISYLSLMAIQRANSGHPGLPLGCALLGVILYKYFLKYTTKNLGWLVRDRFILSAGHGSMLLYSLNYLFFNSFTIKDLANFRKINSKTPGHPEYNIKRGIETTTGPLGQGFANAVGVALESKLLQNRFKQDKNLFQYNVFTLLGDGCMMEGITQESASLAGKLALNNLIAIYDSNNVSIDGRTIMTFSEDVGLKFKAMGWEVLKISGNIYEEIFKGLTKVIKNKTNKPKLIIMQTKIGQGLNKLQGSAKSHGSPVGIEELNFFIKNSSLKKYFPSDEEKRKAVFIKQLEKGNFLIKEKIITNKDFLERNQNNSLYQKWQVNFKKFLQKKENYLFFKNKINEKLKQKLIKYHLTKESDATRNLFSEVLQVVSNEIPTIIGGSADLVASTKATIKNSPYINTNFFFGRNIAYGVREHAMAAINNGLALNNVLIPFSSTFLCFMDYLKPALRLSAISTLKHLYVFSHDSIQVGEDGPTHQPIEQLNSLRLIPNHFTFRPANDIETALSFLFFLENQFPVSVITSRQNLSSLCFAKRNRIKKINDFKKGAYFISKFSKKVDIILMGSGSEVSLLLECQKRLQEKKIKANVISVPCLELFEKSSKSWQEEILNKFKNPVFYLEASSFRSLNSFSHPNFFLKSINSFGCSGEKNEVLKKMNFDIKNILNEIILILRKY